MQEEVEDEGNNSLPTGEELISFSSDSVEEVIAEGSRQ